MLEAAIEIVEAGGDLPMEQMAVVMGQIMDSHGREPQIARLLAALHHKGKTWPKLPVSGRLAPPYDAHSLRPRRFIDTCGTGGDGSKTFNITTAAGPGYGGRRAGRQAWQSRHHQPQRFGRRAGGPGREHRGRRGLRRGMPGRTGHLFLLRPLAALAMKHVAAVRKRLGTPSIFNILGPLVNPASAPFQLLGVGRGIEAALGRGPAAAGRPSCLAGPRGRWPGRSHARRRHRGYRGRGRSVAAIPVAAGRFRS